MLATHDGLQTRDRLVRMGICDDTECLLCGERPEMRDHLYFECKFSQACLLDVLKRMHSQVQKTDITGLWTRVARKANGKLSKAFIMAVLAAVIYKIWITRNDVLWN